MTAQDAKEREAAIAYMVDHPGLVRTDPLGELFIAGWLARDQQAQQPWKDAWDEYRADVLHNADGYENEHVNWALHMIDALREIVDPLQQAQPAAHARYRCPECESPMLTPDLCETGGCPGPPPPEEPCSNCGRTVAGKGAGIDCPACTPEEPEREPDPWALLRDVHAMIDSAIRRLGTMRDEDRAIADTALLMARERMETALAAKEKR